MILAAALVSAYAAISAETAMLHIEYAGRSLSRMFGEKAFGVHSVITVLLWGIAAFALAALQFYEHPSFHDVFILKAAGGVVFAGGIVIGLWGFALLGPKRSLGLNFFKSGVPVEGRGIYRHINNPETAGICWALFGLAFLTGSSYNLMIAAIFTALMIPHTVLENLPLKDAPLPGQ